MRVGRTTRLTVPSRQRTLQPATPAIQTDDSVVVSTTRGVDTLITNVTGDTHAAAVERHVISMTTAALTTTLASVATDWCRSLLLCSFSSWPSGERSRLFHLQSPGVSTDVPLVAFYYQ